MLVGQEETGAMAVLGVPEEATLLLPGVLPQLLAERVVWAVRVPHSGALEGRVGTSPEPVPRAMWVVLAGPEERVQMGVREALEVRL